jgi:decaprenyl-phosphate phosphoribosyltransferase
MRDERSGSVPLSPTDTGGSASIPTGARALLKALRPSQWGKNLLVVLAPLAAGSILEPGIVGRVTIAFMLFAAASSSMYLVNDVFDRHRDAAHPVKRHRPIAAGAVSVRSAITTAVLLSAAALGGSIAFGPPAFTGVIALYLASTTLYSRWLKHEPLYDVVLVASGFLLRAIAGGVATDTTLSSWFLLSATFAALFIAAGKRASELANMSMSGSAAGPDGSTRPNLVDYSPGYLRFIWTLAATVTVAAAALWALEVASDAARPGLAQASVAPFTLAILRYAWWIDRARAEAPESVVRQDPSLAVLGALWVMLLIASTGTGA